MAGFTHRRTFATVALGVALAGAAVVPSAAVFASSATPGQPAASAARIANTREGVRATIVGTSAGPGRDDVEGDAGNDRLFGGKGDDDLEGDRGPIASTAARVGTRARAAGGTTPA